jgi:formate/nitrite transporter FocA (FNT family)
LITLAIGVAHLHHSIAGSIEVLMGVFVGQGASVADFGRFFALSVLGNAVGGSVFVALLKHGHVRHSA